jgi:F-type H+-transporting ATPase subunit epsilon
MNKLYLDVLSEEHSLFSGEVDFVVAPGGDGDLGILPGHSPLLSTLRPGTVRIQNKGLPETHFEVHGGFIELNADKIQIIVTKGES